MKKIFLGILIAILVAVVQPQLANLDASSAAQTQAAVRATTHVIFLESFTDTTGCSATAIGRHALLTASHCELPSDVVAIDGVPGYKIEAILRDGNDHSIFLLRGVEFKATATLATRPPIIGEPVFIFGNPHVENSPVMFVQQYRSGHYVATHLFKGGRLVDVFDFVSKPGDSGAAIFSSQGLVIGVVNFFGVIPVPPRYAEIGAAGAVRLAFSKDTLDKAQKF